MGNRVVIAVVNRKGGSGKTTSSAFLASALHAAGRPVTGVDLEPNKSWLRVKLAGGMLPYEVIDGDRENLPQQVDAIEGDVVIDTPGNDEAVVMIASMVADEVIIPTKYSEIDAGRLMETVSVVAQVERVRGQPLASVLANEVRSNLVIARELREELAARSIPILDTHIPLRAAYQTFAKSPSRADLAPYEAVLKELEVI